MDMKRPEFSQDDNTINSTVEADNFTALLDEDHAAPDKNDFVLEVTDILANEVSVDKDLGADNTEPYEDELLIANELHDDLTFEELVDADVEDDHFETLSDDEPIVFERSESESEADLLADEVFVDEELEAESTELLEVDLLIANELHDDLTFEELVDADVEDDHFETLSDDESIAFGRSEPGSEADLLADEVFVDEELEADSAELPEVDLLIANELHDDLTFEELVDADVEDDHFETLSDDESIGFERSDSVSEVDLLADEVFVVEELEADSTELFGDDLLLTDEPFDELNFDELIERRGETDNLIGESGFYLISEPYGFAEKDDIDQTALATDNIILADSEVRHPVVVEKIRDKVAPCDVEKQGASLQSSENLLHKSNEDLSATENLRDTEKQFPRSFIVLAILAVLAGGVSWYGFNSIGNGTRPLEQRQDERGYQPNQDNLNRYAEQEVVTINQPETLLREAEDSFKTQVNALKEQLGAKTRKNSSELLNISGGIRQLERRLAAVEKDLADFGGKDQTLQVVELAQQLKLLEQLVQEPIKMNQDVTGELTLRLNQLDTSIDQLENRVGRIRRQQNTMHNSLGTVEREIAEITTSVAAIQGDSPSRKTQEEIESDTHSRFDKTISAKGAISEQPKWVVNLASFKNRVLAEKEQKRFNALGVKTMIHEAQIMKTTWYRVRVEGFFSTVSARKYMENIQLKCDGIEDAWVSSCQF
jgi:cell division protein FtsN